ncbi:MAG: cyclic nucleotide-binding domain-containing protein [Rhodospirillales bacterium]|nr:cyclic nucleotide-binding domain-containing protein [Rhodospirillales bacterium]MCB9996782.1 cyclic nucleotide-binding domain-containing protein [Rhodospirillales bacterium]
MYTDLDPRQTLHHHLPRVLNREVYYAGQPIIEQGSGGFNAYYIEKGRVEVMVREGPHKIKLCELGPGEIFGEMALIEQQSRSAAVNALTETTVTVISAHELADKIDRIDDKAVRALMHVFLHRLQQSNAGQLAQYRHLAEFQDRMTGLVEKAGRGIDENRRAAFREDVTPLLDRLEDILEQYRSK